MKIIKTNWPYAPWHPLVGQTDGDDDDAAGDESENVGLAPTVFLLCIILFSVTIANCHQVSNDVRLRCQWHWHRSALSATIIRFFRTSRSNYIQILRFLC